MDVDNSLKVNGIRLSFPILIFIGLIASLPFFSIRSDMLGVGVPIFLLGIIMVVTSFQVASNLKIKSVFSLFDLLIFLYLFIALLSFIYTNEHAQASFSFLKTVAYFSSYIALKIFLASSSGGEIEAALMSGVILGMSFFLLVTIYALIKQDLLFSLSNNFSYYGLTYKVFATIFSLSGSDEIIKSSDIMRNTIGEVFAFYFIVVFFSRVTPKWKKKYYLALNFLFVIGMFSRRAFLAVISILFTKLYLGKNKSLLLLMLFLVSGLSVYVFLFDGAVLTENRLTNFDDTSRVTQYTQAIEIFFNQHVLIGAGYGYKLNEEKYIHNFILSSAVMMGITGLVLSIAIYFLVVWKFIRGIVSSSDSQYSCLLVIPILGMTVGSTVEGMFTPISWIIFAIYDVHRNKVSTIRANKRI